MFDSVSVHGFRRLHSVKLQLKPLNVLIGANGCGKTSLLDVFALLAASASGALARQIGELGGVAANLCKLHFVETPKRLAFQLSDSNSDDLSCRYSILIEPQGIGYSIPFESLDGDLEDNSRFSFIESRSGSVKYARPGGNPLDRFEAGTIQMLESALSQAPKAIRQAYEFRRTLASMTHYHTLEVGPRAPIRLPQQVFDANLPGPQGETLASCLFSIREKDGERFELIQDTLRAGFPAFERLNFPPVAAGTLAMTWKDRTSSTPFYMHQLSEGTLRFLWLVTLLNSPGLTAVTMIDEPEVSLHPELLSVLADVMRDASTRTQLIVATHADRLVRFLKPEEIITTTIDENGAATFAWGDTFELDHWLQDYSLDQLWQMGRLGGRA